jgi:hypothetical protein
MTTRGRDVTNAVARILDFSEMVSVLMEDLRSSVERITVGDSVAARA